MHNVICVLSLTFHMTAEEDFKPQCALGGGCTSCSFFTPFQWGTFRYIYLLQISYGIDCKYKIGICTVFMDKYRCIFKIDFCWSVQHIIYYYYCEHLQILTRPILCCFLRGNLGCLFPGLQTLSYGFRKLVNFMAKVNNE